MSQDDIGLKYQIALKTSFKGYIKIYNIEYSTVNALQCVFEKELAQPWRSHLWTLTETLIGVVQHSMIQGPRTELR